MRQVLLIATLLLLTSAGWRTDFSKAKEEAAREHKLILLKFSGSDWCLPCIRMEKNIFTQDIFTRFADSNLVMINADFPRQRKNQPAPEILKQNEMLAEQYDKEGHFPLTVLLDADGKVLKRWDGDPGISPGDFIRQIKTIEHAD